MNIKKKETSFQSNRVNIKDRNCIRRGNIMKRLLILILNILLMISIITAASATSILYDTTHLGGGIWQYSYRISDYTFNTDYGFTIYFDYGLYENITPITDSDDWDELSWEPSQLLGDGAYDALALIDNASLDEDFKVEFNWLGEGTPNSQDFEIYYYNPFQILDKDTTKPIPEPWTSVLLGSLLLGLVGCSLKKQD